MYFKIVCAFCFIAAGCINISLGQSVENPCSCGPQGIDCKYTNGAKVCSCQQGFKQNQDSCELCNCRRHFSDCNFVDGYMNCTCDVGYVQKNDLCVEACSIRKPCQNGGMCINGKCSCKKGLAGHFCQIIEACDIEYLCGDDPDTTCLYDTAKEKAFCRCEKSSQIFVKSEQKCRVPCANTSECLYGGECLQKEEGKFCNCKPGLLGDFCEIPNCDKPCHKGASCTFEKELERWECMCKESDELPDSSQQTCRKPCESDSDCKYGGECKAGENAKFCGCKKGTSGSFCEKLDDCYLCGDSDDIACKYNVTEEKTQCLCHDKEKIFEDGTRTCKVPCDSHSDCLNSASCSPCALNYPYHCSEKPVCRCKKGTSGDKCQIIDKCESGEIDCGDGDDVECSFDPILSLASCKCKGALMGFDDNDKTCKDCSCGPQTMFCDIDQGEKYCDCYTGYVQIEDTCEECNCGEGSRGCRILRGYWSPEKRCDCLDGYEQNGNVCKKCDCGTSSYYCKFDKENGKRICGCWTGFKQNGDTCQRCDCGDDSYDCAFKEGEKICNCFSTFVQENGRCVREEGTL